MTQGRAGAAGNPVNVSIASATTPAPAAISTVAAIGSNPCLMVAFHPAWAAAAQRTAAKTRESISADAFVTSHSMTRSPALDICRPTERPKSGCPRPPTRSNYALLENTACGESAYAHDAPADPDRARRRAQLLDRHHRLSRQAAGLPRRDRHHPGRPAARARSQGRLPVLVGGRMDR